MHYNEVLCLLLENVVFHIVQDGCKVHTLSHVVILPVVNVVYAGCSRKKYADLVG